MGDSTGSDPEKGVLASERKADTRAKSQKDGWDKVSILAQALVPILLALLTYVYGRAEAKERKRELDHSNILQQDNITTAKASAMANLLPFMSSQADTNQVILANLALESLGYMDIAAQYAVAHPTGSGVRAMQILAANGTTTATRSIASKALAQIAGDSGTVRDTAVASQAGAALAQVQIAESGPGPASAIVTGNFGSMTEALADARQGRSQGFDVFVFVRNSALRTAIRYPTRGSAQSAIRDVRRRIRSSAYGVDWAAWCPGVKEEGDHFVCERSLPEQPLF